MHLYRYSRDPVTRRRRRSLVLRKLSYARRRELLAELVVDGPALLAPRHFIGQGEALLAATAEHGLDGIVAKRLDAPYAEGQRSRAWVTQNRRRNMLAVTGWQASPGERPEIVLARRRGDGSLAARQVSAWTSRPASVSVEAEPQGVRPR